MIFHKKKVVPSPPEPKKAPEPERLTQEEWKQVAEFKQKIADIKAEESKIPHLKDFVRILIDGGYGQIVDGTYPPGLSGVSYYPYNYTPPRNELERIKEKFDSASKGVSYFNNNYKYSVRLKNGYIIRELRPWEIAKVSDR